MISEEEALGAIMARVQPLPARSVPLAKALGHFPARDVFGTVPLPGFDNSSMDGYAVRARDACTGARLRVAGEQPAGLDCELRLGPGEAIRIFTGAPIPAGADAVIMQEDVSAQDGGIVVNTSVDPGENVRRAGSDLAQGQKVLTAGQRVTPQSLALLAAQGFGELEIGGRLPVAIISTGDELARPGETLQRGQIYESNSILMAALVTAAGAAPATVETIGDDPDALAAAIRRGLKMPVLILTGGVSVGARDFVKPVLRSLDVETEFWRVAIKPGKPFLFGRRDDCLVFGLPGNPVSAFVTFLLLVRPSLLRLMGAAPDELRLPSYPARVSAHLANTGDRPHYLRGQLRKGQFALAGRQESHALYGLNQSNALVRLEPGQQIAAGEMVDALVWY